MPGMNGRRGIILSLARDGDTNIWKRPDEHWRWCRLDAVVLFSHTSNPPPLPNSWRKTKILSEALTVKSSYYTVCNEFWSSGCAARWVGFSQLNYESHSRAQSEKI